MKFDKKIIWIFPKARGGAYTTPENVKAIGECAFFQCVNLTEVVISDNVTVIGRNAFYTCSNLRKVVIGDNVLAIREGAFLHCQRLTDISFGEGLLCIDDNIFHLNRSLKEIDLSKCTKLTDVGEYVFYGNELTTVKLPNSLKTIGDYAFDECKYLQEVTLGENITYIGNEAFDNCNSLTKIQIFSNELVAIFGSSIQNPLLFIVTKIQLLIIHL